MHYTLQWDSKTLKEQPGVTKRLKRVDVPEAASLLLVVSFSILIIFVVSQRFSQSLYYRFPIY
jgi:hypothetical protein